MDSTGWQRAPFALELDDAPGDQDLYLVYTEQRPSERAIEHRSLPGHRAVEVSENLAVAAGHVEGDPVGTVPEEQRRRPGRPRALQGVVEQPDVDERVAEVDRGAGEVGLAGRGREALCDCCAGLGDVRGGRSE